jgi:predicted dinucleotide-binding enzyme
VKIGILGSGDVGKSFARGFKKRGDDVMIGSRSAEKLADWARENNVQNGTFEETAKFGEMIVIGTLGVATEEALRMAGESNFDGKVVIDATNPLTFAPGGPPTLAIGGTDSLGERVQTELPSARVVKAFNTVGNAHYVDPQFPGGPPDMFLCGNDAAAKKQVADLCRDWGWGVVDIGGIEGSRYLEPMCMTWVLHGVIAGSWNHAFKLLRK